MSDSRYFISARPLGIQCRLPRLVGEHPDTLSFEPHANPGHPPHYTPSLALLLASRRCRLVAAAAGATPPPTATLTVQGRLALFPASARIVAGVDVGAAARQPRRRQGPGAGDRIAGRQEHARRVPAPHRLRSDQADRPASPSPSPRTRAPAATSAWCCARIASTRRAWSPTRATSCRRKATISVRHQARPPDALVVEARSRAWSASSSTNGRSCSARAGGARAWPTSPTRPTPATAPRPTSSWSAWSSARPARTRSGAPRWSPTRPAARWRRSRGFAEAATINTLSAAIDFGKGLEATLIADVATPDAARALATKVTESLRDAKRNPQVLMLGLGPVPGRRQRARRRPHLRGARHARRARRSRSGHAARRDGLARARAAPRPGFAPPPAP